jgi:hypothetical protein
MFSVIRLRTILSTFSCDTQRSGKLCCVVLILLWPSESLPEWLVHSDRISTLVWHFKCFISPDQEKRSAKDKPVKQRTEQKPTKHKYTWTTWTPIEWEGTLVLIKSKQFLSIAIHLLCYPWSCPVVVKSDEWEMILQQLHVSCNLGNIHLVTFNNIGAT